MLTQSHPDRANKLLELAKEDVAERWETYSQMANPKTNGKGKA
jgi:hypothetical protein